jgi:hypothetical protein
MDGVDEELAPDQRMHGVGSRLGPSSFRVKSGRANFPCAKRSKKIFVVEPLAELHHVVGSRERSGPGHPSARAA